MKILISSLVIFLLTQNAMASGNRGAWSTRFHLDIGAWGSNFELTGNGSKVSISPLINYGFEVGVGLRISSIFFEYQLVWLVPPYSARPKPRDASYASILGGIVGLTFTNFPVEPFVGIEGGRFGLSDGMNPSYPNTTYKAGVNIIFGNPEIKHTALILEYRHMPLKKDNVGTLPTGFTGTVQILFLAISLRA